MEQNTVLYWVLILNSALISMSLGGRLKSYRLLFFPIYFGLLFFSLEYAEYGLDTQVWNQTERTSNCYDWFEHYLMKDYDLNKDYSEGLFFGDSSLTIEEATLNKYDYIFDKLELKPGMKLLDAGCGTGKWMEYCHKKGVEVYGLTLSSEQADKVRKKGLDVSVWDYRVKYEPFISYFDRITALGSSEHVCSTTGNLIGQNVTQDRCNKMRIDAWKLFYQYLKPGGGTKAYITLLTTNPNKVWGSYEWFQGYILERHYGGYYSTMYDIEHNVIPNTGFKLADVQDKTWDYFWTSIVDKDHFGQWTIKWEEDTWDKLTYMCYGLVKDPFLVHHWLYYIFDTWMWQFDKFNELSEMNRNGSDAHVMLKYFMLEK